jgi:hypothetical protein
VKLILAGLALLVVVTQTPAESRTVLVQVKQDKDKKTSVAIHSDEKAEQKSAVSVDDAVKVVGEMKGWGSQVGVYITADRGVPAADLKKLFVAVSDNHWLGLEYFGREVPAVVADHFLKAAKPKDLKETIVGKWESDDADKIPVEFGADGSIRLALHQQDWKWQVAVGTYAISDDGKVKYTAKLGKLAVAGHFTMKDGILIHPAGSSAEARWKKVPAGPASSSALPEQKAKEDEPDRPAPAHTASDVVLIANWVCGSDPAGAFAKPFGDSKFLADAKDPLLYTDIPGVKTPAGMKAANYEFVQARVQQIKSGHKVSPAVLIVRSSPDEPAGGEVRPAKGEADGRVYYVEVAIGNLARHWLKVVVRDEGDKPKAKILWTKVS